MAATTLDVGPDERVSPLVQPGVQLGDPLVVLSSCHLPLAGPKGWRDHGAGQFGVNAGISRRRLLGPAGQKPNIQR